MTLVFLTCTQYARKKKSSSFACLTRHKSALCYDIVYQVRAVCKDKIITTLRREFWRTVQAGTRYKLQCHDVFQCIQYAGDVLALASELL